MAAAPAPHLVIEVPVRGSRVRIVLLDGVEIARTSRDVLILAELDSLLASDSGDDPTCPADPCYALDQQLCARIREVEPRAAWERALRLIAYRDRSVLETERALQRDGYSQGTVDVCVTRLLDAGLLDDVRFAEAYARTKCTAGWGRRRISAGLRSAGVPDWASTEVLDTCESDEARATRLAQRWQIDSDRDARRAMGRLARRGFDSTTCSRVVRSRRATAATDDPKE